MGRRGQQVGLVPQRFFEEQQPPPMQSYAQPAPPVAPDYPTGGYPAAAAPPPPAQPEAGGFEAVALGHYEAKGHGDVSFAAGQRLTVLPQAAPQSGWWLARLGEGPDATVGLVPGTYVQRVQEPPPFAGAAGAGL